MKIRTGFVTNSSSTSYTVVIEKEYFNEIISKFSPFVSAVCRALAAGEPRKFLGNDVIVIDWENGNVNTTDYIEVGMEPDAQEIDDANKEGYDPKIWAVQQFTEALEDKSRYIMSTVEC